MTAAASTRETSRRPSEEATTRSCRPQSRPGAVRTPGPGRAGRSVRRPNAFQSHARARCARRAVRAAAKRYDVLLGWPVRGVVRCGVRSVRRPAPREFRRADQTRSVRAKFVPISRPGGGARRAPSAGSFQTAGKPAASGNCARNDGRIRKFGSAHAPNTAGAPHRVNLFIARMWDATSKAQPYVVLTKRCAPVPDRRARRHAIIGVRMRALPAESTARRRASRAVLCRGIRESGTRAAPGPAPCLHGRGGNQGRVQAAATGPRVPDRPPPRNG